MNGRQRDEVVLKEVQFFLIMLLFLSLILTFYEYQMNVDLICGSLYVICTFMYIFCVDIVMTY